MDGDAELSGEASGVRAEDLLGLAVVMWVDQDVGGVAVGPGFRSGGVSAMVAVGEVAELVGEGTESVGFGHPVLDGDCVRWPPCGFWSTAVPVDVIGVLGWVGVLSDIQADQVTEQVDKWLPILLGVLAPALAATKTHQGSDSTATDADAEVASLLGSAHDVADIVVQQVKTVTPQDVASAVLAAIRAEEKGEHDTAAGTAATAEAITDYVYGR